MDIDPRVKDLTDSEADGENSSEEPLSQPGSSPSGSSSSGSSSLYNDGSQMFMSVPIHWGQTPHTEPVHA
jgi:hypothetical protein